MIIRSGKACKNCDDKDRYCGYHNSNNHYRGSLKSRLSSGMKKKFRIIDPDDKQNKIKTVEMTEVERETSNYIEVTVNVASCSSCRNFINCRVYTNFKKQGSVRFVICSNCYQDEKLTIDKLINLLLR